MRLKDFRHKTAVQTRFADVDMMGHVNNAKYLTYIEEARIQYARDIFEWDGVPNSLGMILAKTVIDYLLPLPAGVTIEVFTRCSRIGRKSFDLSYFMIIPKGEELVSTSVTTMVAYNYQTRKPVFVPDAWRERIIAYEKVEPHVG